MGQLRRGIAVAAIAAIFAGYAVPAAAEEPATGRSAATIVKWTLIGVATGAAIGFVTGFNAYDDATFAESKIGKATVAGGALGAAGGFAIGLMRSRPSSPRVDGTTTLWRPDGKMPARPAQAWTVSRPAPTLRSLSLRVASVVSR